MRKTLIFIRLEIGYTFIKAMPVLLTVFTGDPKARTFDFTPRDTAVIPDNSC